MNTATVDRLVWGDVLSIRNFSRALLLCASLFILWYIVMIAIGAYIPKIHLLATFSSALYTGQGRGWGVLEKLIR